MEKEEIKALLKRYVDGKCTEEEKTMLEAWYLEYNEGPVDIPPEKIRGIGEEIFRKLPGNGGREFSPAFLLAAAVIGLIMVSLALSVVFRKSDMTVQVLPHDIPPGSKKAVLTLANGKKIDLTASATGAIAVQGGIHILKNQSGEVVYREEGGGNQHDPEGGNNISTPAGGTWEVQLPDGTKVWLNNSSSLSYPASFRGRKDRVVLLDGEAYFEVAKDKTHPFIVKSGQQEVKVLGTHFNIRAFRDEPVIWTTLLEGKVTVGKTGSEYQKQLLPGKQSLFNASHLVITDANTEEVMAWKNGYFRFDNTPVEQVMRELARWYGIDVRYEGPVSEEKLDGRISRSKNISKVLIALEATKTVRFKVEGRRVTVMK